MSKYSFNVAIAHQHVRRKDTQTPIRLVELIGERLYASQGCIPGKLPQLVDGAGEEYRKRRALPYVVVVPHYEDHGYDKSKNADLRSRKIQDADPPRLMPRKRKNRTDNQDPGEDEQCDMQHGRMLDAQKAKVENRFGTGLVSR